MSHSRQTSGYHEMAQPCSGAPKPGGPGYNVHGVDPAGNVVNDFIFEIFSLVYKVQK